MDTRRRLQQAIQGMPEGGSIVLPVAAVQEWLREDLMEAGDHPAGQRALTTSEAAERLDVQPSTVADYCKGELFPNAFKTGVDGGGEWRIPEGDLLNFMQNGKDGTDRVHFD